MTAAIGTRRAPCRQAHRTRGEVRPSPGRHRPAAADPPRTGTCRSTPRCSPRHSPDDHASRQPRRSPRRSPRRETHRETHRGQRIRTSDVRETKVDNSGSMIVSRSPDGRRRTAEQIQRNTDHLINGHYQYQTPTNTPVGTVRFPSPTPGRRPERVSPGCSPGGEVRRGPRPIGFRPCSRARCPGRAAGGGERVRRG